MKSEVYSADYQCAEGKNAFFQVIIAKAGNPILVNSASTWEITTKFDSPWMKKEDLIILLIGLLLAAAMVATIFLGGEKSMHGVGRIHESFPRSFQT